MLTMNELKAHPIIKNKFWIVEKDGTKVATIQASDEGGVFYVHDDRREKFSTINLLKAQYNIEFSKASVKTKPKPEFNVYGYPTDHKPYNDLYDVTKKLPIYTKEEKSKSFYCAGHYLVKFGNCWTKEFCPKLITLQRYEYQGPFHTIEELQQKRNNNV